MRAVVVVLALAGCASASERGDDPFDASSQTCATTACVPGATCRLAGAGMCQCFEVGRWTCNNSGPPTPPPEAGDTDPGFVFDTGTAPPPDSGMPASPDAAGEMTFAYALPEGGCSDRVAACTDETTIASATALLRSIMSKCGMACSRLTLRSAGECPFELSVNREWIAGALKCVAVEIERYRWPCTSLYEAETTSCPK